MLEIKNFGAEALRVIARPFIAASHHTHGRSKDEFKARQLLVTVLHHLQM